MTLRAEHGGPRPVNGGPEAQGKRPGPNVILPLAIVAVAPVLAAMVLRFRCAHRQERQLQLHSEMTVRMAATLEHVEGYLANVHSLLLHVSLDPDVRAMRNEAPAHIRAVFANQAPSHRLAEFCVIARGFDGTRPPVMTLEPDSDDSELDELHSSERELDAYLACLKSIPNGTYGDVAESFDVTKARVCQMLALLKKLPPEITDAIAGTEDERFRRS